MAIDTQDKRASALREGLLPLPDGLPLNPGDRQQVLWQYRGIAANPSVVGSGVGYQTVGVIHQNGIDMMFDSSTGLV